MQLSEGGVVWGLGLEVVRLSLPRISLLISALSVVWVAHYIWQRCCRVVTPTFLSLVAYYFPIHKCCRVVTPNS